MSPAAAPGMRVLLADDDAILRYALDVQLQRWGYDPVVCEDGEQARAVLQSGNAPALAILDWSMPRADGITLCREIRATPALSTMYVMLLTARDTLDEMVAGLEQGADEYIVKPFDWGVLRARLNTGARVAVLQQHLAQRVEELQNALATVKQLSGLLPICAYCKRIRRDDNYWQQLEAYIAEHSEADFSHGVCPPCLEKAKKEFGF